MAKKKTAAVEEPVNTEAAPAEVEVAYAPAPVPTSKTAITVKYRDHRGEATERTFSKDVHGADFTKLADEFKATNASRLIQ